MFQSNSPNYIVLCHTGKGRQTKIYIFLYFFGIILLIKKNFNIPKNEAMFDNNITSHDFTLNQKLAINKNVTHKLPLHKLI